MVLSCDMNVQYLASCTVQYLAPVHSLRFTSIFKIMTSYNYYYDLTSGVYQAATPSSQAPHHGNLSVNVAAPPPWCQPSVQLGSSTTPPSRPSTLVQTPRPQGDQSKVDAYLRVLNPANKKDFRLFILRNLSRDMDSPEKLKMAIFTQCGDETVPPPTNMELGFYNQTKKLWINNRLDVNDLWELASKSDKLTLWCVGAGSNSKSSRNTKRSNDERDKDGTAESEPPKKMTKMEEKRALADDYEKKLKEKHPEKYSKFQYKFWAEMLAHDQHQSFDDPPGHAMFKRESTKGAKKGQDGPADDSVISGMISVMNSLCSAITPVQNKQEVRRATLSPMKKAELRSIYIKQLSELRLLHEGVVLSADEYEEQRNIDLMRQLKDNK